MKKILCILLAMMLFVSIFAGCGKTPAETDTPDASESAEPKETDNADDKDDKEFALGVVDGSSYKNDFAELSFTLPEGWVFASEEELEEMMGAGSEAIFGEDKQAALEYALKATVYDMMAQNADDGSNVIVMFENTAMYAGGTSMTEEEYLAALAENLGTVDSIAYTVDETTTKATMNGVEYAVLGAKIDAYSAYQSYYVRRIGKYMLCLCFTGYDVPNPGSTMQAYFEQ